MHNMKPTIPNTTFSNSEHDLEFISELLCDQNAFLEVLVDHVAHVEAALSLLVLQTLPEKVLYKVKEFKDHILSDIHERLAAEAEGDAEDL
jgi:hypothetical protein